MSDRQFPQQPHKADPSEDDSLRSPAPSLDHSSFSQASSQASSQLPPPSSRPSSSHTHSSHAQKKRSRQKWRRQLRYFYIRFVRMRGTPKAIARGLAAGVFAGWFPLFGLQTIIGVAIASIVRGNKIMAAAGTWVSNPFTYVPIYYFNFRIGQGLLSRLSIDTDMPNLEAIQEIVSASGWAAFSDFLSLGAAFILTLFLGCFVTGIISAILAYAVGIKFAQVLRRRKSKLSKPKV